MKTLIFTNLKGGCGKTTSALSVGAGLYRHGFKVLLVDTDAQGHLSIASGAIPDENDPTIYEVLKGRATAADAIRTTPGGYDILPSDIRLSGADIELASAAGRDFILREALSTVAKRYDYAVIDSPPNLGVITLMGLTAADGVIIPLNSEYLGVDGVAQLRNTANIVKRRLNPKLKITGILLTFYDARTNTARKTEAQINEGLPGKLFETKITRCNPLAKAPETGRDIYEFKPASKAKKAIEQYTALTEEVISRTTRAKRTHS